MKNGLQRWINHSKTRCFRTRKTEKENERKCCTHSVDSTVGVVGIIINIQFVRIVVMIISENNGCTKIEIATRRIGLNGSSNHIAFDAEKRKISFPLLTTTNVCLRVKEKKKGIK